MTVLELLNILCQAEDMDIAPIEFWIGDKSYEVESVGQFGMIPDVTVSLKEVTHPILTPIPRFKRNKVAEINKVMKKINKARDFKEAEDNIYGSGKIKTCTHEIVQSAMKAVEKDVKKPIIKR